jgi:hypothetical protein
MKIFFIWNKISLKKIISWMEWQPFLRSFKITVWKILILVLNICIFFSEIYDSRLTHRYRPFCFDFFVQGNGLSFSPFYNTLEKSKNIGTLFSKLISKQLTVNIDCEHSSELRSGRVIGSISGNVRLHSHYALTYLSKALKAKATRAQITTVASRIFHRSRM